VNQPAPGPTHGSSSPLSAVARGVRGHPVPVALVAILVAGLVVLTVVAFGGSGNLPAASGRPSGGGTADAQAATTVTKGSKWLASSGATQLGAVSADAGKVMAAEQASHGAAAAKAAGARLATAAGAALNGSMPPVDATTYRTALRDLEAAGSAAASGQYGSKVARLVNAGEAGLMRVTAAADAPVSQKTAAIPEPNGQ
jgi:hypothetical protein